MKCVWSIIPLQIVFTRFWFIFSSKFDMKYKWELSYLDFKLLKYLTCIVNKRYSYDYKTSMRCYSHLQIKQNNLQFVCNI